MAQPERLSTRLPAFTMSCACLALIAYLWPHLSDSLVYERQAILGGEIWRLATAVFVHFSLSHILWDLLVFSAAGWAIEAGGYRGFPLVCTLAAVTPGIYFLLASPEITRYGGLSGLATAAVAYLCLCETRKAGRNRILWIAILALIGVKNILEAVTGTPIFVSADHIPFRVLPSAHAFGYAAALAGFIWARPTRPCPDAAASAGER